MKPVFLLVMLVAISTVAHPQVTCQTYGNTTNCNGKLGSGVSAVGVQDFNAPFRAQQQAQAAQTAANAQAELANAQADAIRQQTASVNAQTELSNQQSVDAHRQHILDKVAAGSDDDLRKASLYFYSHKCSDDPTCNNYSSFALDAIHAETQRRITVCMARFPTANWTVSYDRCKEDPAAAPPSRDVSPVKLAATNSPSAPPSSPLPNVETEFHRKFTALSDALENGVITRAEYDKKLSALMQTNRARNVQ